MIRILHTIDTTGPGGAENVFLNLVKGLDRNKFEPVVAIRGPGWVCDELKKIGINPLFINSKGSFNFIYLRELIGIIRRNSIDIIQSHLLGSNFYCSLAGIICGVPVVSTFHGFVDINGKERFSEIKCKIINRGSEKLVFVSNMLKNFYLEKKDYSARKSVTIYNGIDCSVFKPQRDDSIKNKLGLGPDNILVGAVGNIRPSKGYEYLLKAARLVVDKYPQFRFVVAGEGSGRFFENMLIFRDKMGLEKHFIFLGFEPDISKFMNNIDIYVLSSVSEGFSISTIEAMACGVPVIATRSGGPEEIITHMVNGILVETKNPDDLSKQIIKLISDDSLKKSLVKNSIDYVKKGYSIIELINNYSNLYLSCCFNKGNTKWRRK